MPAVLIAEDNDAFRAEIVALLQPLALTCIAVADGSQAIDVLRDRSQEMHLLITDMEMPLHTGWEVIEAARQHRGEELPIIMQTGQAQYTYVWRKAQDLGIVLIDKLDLDGHLLPAVRRALGLSPEGSSAG